MGIFGRKRDDSPQPKTSKELIIMNRLGMHARPSAQFVKACSRFRCEVWVEKDGEQVNGKSIMGLMMLAAGMGSKLKVTCEGADADRALEEIEALIERKFDEE
jgi:phosphocarrier protein